MSSEQKDKPVVVSSLLKSLSREITMDTVGRCVYENWYVGPNSESEIEDGTVPEWVDMSDGVKKRWMNVALALSQLITNDLNTNLYVVEDRPDRKLEQRLVLSVDITNPAPVPKLKSKAVNVDVLNKVQEYLESGTTMSGGATILIDDQGRRHCSHPNNQVYYDSETEDVRCHACGMIYNRLTKDLNEFLEKAMSLSPEKEEVSPDAVANIYVTAETLDPNLSLEEKQEQITEHRKKLYGDAEFGHRNLGLLWRAALQNYWQMDLPELPAFMVILMMAYVKTNRMAFPAEIPNPEDLLDSTNYLRLSATSRKVTKKTGE